MRITKTFATLAMVVVGAGVLAGAALAESGANPRSDPTTGGPGFMRTADGFGPGAMMTGNGPQRGGPGMGFGGRGHHGNGWGRQDASWGQGGGCPGRGGAFPRNSF